MLRFLRRRLLIALPSLLGITLITFALIHLAPGDPLAAGSEGAGGPISGPGRETTRRLYFLDLPLFYNPRPRGLDARLERILARLQRGEPTVEQAVAGARRCGTVCLPGLLQARQDARPLVQRRIDQVLAGLQADHPRLAESAATPLVWARQATPLLGVARLEQLAGQLGLSPEAEEELLTRGSAALPAVMALLLEGEGQAQQAAASRVASALTSSGAALVGQRAQDAGALARWSEWWFQERREYVPFGRGERLWGRLTETQYGKWLRRLLSLQLGVSTRDGQPVLDKLATALPVTLLLSVLALGLAVLVAVPLGVHAAVRRGTLGERLITQALFVLYSLPPFFVAMLLILFFGGVGYLDWFPIYGLRSPGLEQAGGLTWLADRLHHLVLPVFCLTYGSLAVLSRYQRSAMLEVLQQDYIRTARAKGLGERAVIFRHALRNALLPLITLLGLQLPYLIGGSVIIERIFNIPGMGLLTFQAFLTRDYPVIMAVSVLSAGLTLLGLILADLFYAVADPRISLERAR